MHIAVTRALTGVFLLIGVAKPAIVVDQEATPGIFSVANQAAQTFRPAADNISGLGLAIRWLNPASGPADAILLDYRIYDALPLNGGNLLAQASATGVTFEQGADRFFDLSFASPLAVTPGAEYFFVWNANTPIGTLARAGSYPNGNYVLLNGQSFPALDAAFRTFTDTSFNANPIPEPSTILLSFAGAAAVLLRGSMVQ